MIEKIKEASPEELTQFKKEMDSLYLESELLFSEEDRLEGEKKIILDSLTILSTFSQEELDKAISESERMAKIEEKLQVLNSKIIDNLTRKQEVLKKIMELQN